MSGPLVSLGIPTLDRLHYLRQAVASAAAQTHRDIEILISDDGDSPELREWALAACARDPRIRYARNDRRRGLAGNWNELAGRARGEYLAIFGDDDRLLPEFVERLLAAAQGADVVFSNHHVIDSEGNRLPAATRRFTESYGRARLPAGRVEHAEETVWRNAVPMSSSLIRTRIAQALRFDESLNTPEIEFFLRAVRAGATFAFVPELLAEYRVGEATATGRGLDHEALARALLPFEVAPAHEDAKRRFLGPVVASAASLAMRRHDFARARELLASPYYPGERTGRAALARAVARMPRSIASAVVDAAAAAVRFFRR